MRKQKLHSFGHVYKCLSDAIVKGYTIQFSHCAKRGCTKTKRTYMDTMQTNIKKLELNIDIIYDKIK